MIFWNFSDFSDFSIFRDFAEFSIFPEFSWFVDFSNFAKNHVKNWKIWTFNFRNSMIFRNFPIFKTSKISLILLIFQNFQFPGFFLISQKFTSKTLKISKKSCLTLCLDGLDGFCTLLTLFSGPPFLAIWPPFSSMATGIFPFFRQITGSQGCHSPKPHYFHEFFSK